MATKRDLIVCPECGERPCTCAGKPKPPPGCICSEAYGVGPDKCPGHLMAAAPDDELMCANCRHSYAQHTKGANPIKYCRHCLCVEWVQPAASSGRTAGKPHPTYYVRHPDDTYSVADPQPCGAVLASGGGLGEGGSALPASLSEYLHGYQDGTRDAAENFGVIVGKDAEEFLAKLDAKITPERLKYLQGLAEQMQRAPQRPAPKVDAQQFESWVDKRAQELIDENRGGIGATLSAAYRAVALELMAATPGETPPASALVIAREIHEVLNSEACGYYDGGELCLTCRDDIAPLVERAYAAGLAAQPDFRVGEGPASEGPKVGEEVLVCGKITRIQGPYMQIRLDGLGFPRMTIVDAELEHYGRTVWPAGEPRK